MLGNRLKQPLGTDPASVADAEADLADRYVRRIKTSDPQFFERFAARMQSGDHVEVQEAYLEGQTLLEEVSQQELEDMANGPATTVAGFWIVHDSFLATYIAVLLFVALTQIDATPVIKKPPTRLALDMKIDDMTTQLALRHS